VAPTAIFFDMDDTLVDGLTAMTAAWDRVCSEAAARFSCAPDELRSAIRREADAFWHDESAVEHWRLDLEGARVLILERALGSHGFDLSPARELAAWYTRLHRENLHPFDDTYAALDALRGAGFKLGLLTNGPSFMQRDKVERFGFDRYFDVIVIEGEFGNGKPHARVFQHALAATGAEPASAWHIGDNLYADIGGAQSAGVHAVWIHRDRIERRETDTAVPDRVIAHLPELYEPLGL
jgi:putative hydrolase of the HAD superfamily